MWSPQLIGHLLSSNSLGFKFACLPDSLPGIRIGQLLKSKTIANQPVYAVLSGIEWVSDELILQLAKAASISAGVIADNLLSRTAGPIIEAITVGCETSDGRILHTLPSSALTSLSEVTICSQDEMTCFTKPGSGYLQYLLQSPAVASIADIVAYHMQEIRSTRDEVWFDAVLEDLCDFLIDDPHIALRIIQHIEQLGLEG